MNHLRILWISVCLMGTMCGQAFPFPTPPQQTAPWSLPEGVADPDGKIKATVDTLFGLGLADPRGCSYRHVTIRENGESIPARGWVLESPEAPRVIGWNGLIYPVEKIGEAADLAADVEILKKNGNFQEEPMANYREETLDRLLAQFAAKPRMMRAWAASYLLLRLGHPVAIANPAGDPFSADDSPFDFGKDGKLTFPAWPFGDPRYWLEDFGLLLRDDGVAAFVDKNDALAAARLQPFDAVWAEVEKRLPHVEGEKEVDPFEEGGSPPTRPWLHPAWRSIMADARRRLEPATESGPSEWAREIATWDRMEAWDEEAPPATFEKVVAAGPAAIGPLLDCVENDKRWMRFPNYRSGVIIGDGYKGPSRLLRVRDMAIFALERVLRFPVIDMAFDDVPLEESSYAGIASRLREFCNKYDQACGEELWFRLLGDPEADPGDQLSAAKLIVRPDGAEDYFPDSFFPPTARERFEDPTPSREGKLLRGRHDPSVLDLLKRAYLRSRSEVDDRLAAGEPEVTQPSFVCASPVVLRSGCNQFVRLMEEWQPGNLGVLKSHDDWLAVGIANLRIGKSSNDFLGIFFLSNFREEALIRRFWSEDETAMQDYEKLYRSSVSSERVPLAVMCELPAHPGMDALAKEAFLGKDAPMSLIRGSWRTYDSREILIDPFGGRCPLLVLPSFRQALIEALGTQTKVGTLVIKADGADLKYDSARQNDVRSLSKDAAFHGGNPVGESTEVRTCDLIAWFLTPKRGPEIWTSPAFHLDDPLPDRDRAIGDWIKVLAAAAPPP